MTRAAATLLGLLLLACPPDTPDDPEAWREQSRPRGMHEPCSGVWDEAVAEPELADLAAGFEAMSWHDSAVAVADRALPPVGKTLAGALSGEDLLASGFIGPRPPETWNELLAIVDTAVHEGCHAHTFELETETHQRFLVQPAASDGATYALPKLAAGRAWPPRRSVEPLVPAAVRDNPWYRLYFTDEVAPGSGGADLAALADEFVCYLHGDVAALALGLEEDGLMGSATFRLMLPLYLRQLRDTAPDQWDALMANGEAAGLMVALYDRAAWAIDAARDRGLLAGDAEPLDAGAQTEANSAVMDALRAATCAP